VSVIYRLKVFCLRFDLFMPPRFHVSAHLQSGFNLSLPPSAARHAQVLRLQPESPLILFNGEGGEWSAVVTRMGKHEVDVCVQNHDADAIREWPSPITLAIGMPANDRMDDLIEKATELGVAVIQPLHSQRAVLRLQGERAQKRVAHWQAVAIAACEQSGRTRPPKVAPVQSLNDWLAAGFSAADQQGFLLSPLATHSWSYSKPNSDAHQALCCLSGPEGGLTAVPLGQRILRADTAPLAWLASVTLSGLR
jgi:16S rRNA (uracil1498-N3)-methyltransferase